MKKIFIEVYRIDSFLRDLENRLNACLASEAAQIDRLMILAIGESGTQIAKRLFGLHGGDLKVPTASEATGLAIVQSTADGFVAI